jgi:preprotein translocase subunit SecE
MKDLLPYLIWFGVALVLFIIFWRQGLFVRLSAYWREMMEELQKCTWPTWEELMGSTTVVIVSVAILGGFTIAVDYVVTLLIRLIV